MEATRVGLAQASKFHKPMVITGRKSMLSNFGRYHVAKAQARSISTAVVVRQPCPADARSDEATSTTGCHKARERC
jgi:hypothetical protein